VGSIPPGAIQFLHDFVNDVHLKAAHQGKVVFVISQNILSSHWAKKEKRN
jgi:hypothetical protein